MVSYSRYIWLHFCLLLKVLQPQRNDTSTCNIFVLSDSQKDHESIAGRHEHCEAFCSFDGHWLRTFKVAGCLHSEALRWAVKDPCGKWCLNLWKTSSFFFGMMNGVMESLFQNHAGNWGAYGASSLGCMKTISPLKRHKNGSVSVETKLALSTNLGLLWGLQDSQKGSSRLQQMSQMKCYAVMQCFSVFF